MSESKSEQEAKSKRTTSAAERPAATRSQPLFGDLTPAEAGRLRAAKAREKRERAELDAELDKLTVAQRLATSSSRKLKTADLDEMIDAMKSLVLNEKAPASSRVQAFKTLADLTRYAVEEDEENTEGMTPGQIAAMRAWIRDQLEEGAPDHPPHEDEVSRAREHEA
jgi:hypothetical protein